MQYRDGKQGWYVVARNFFLLLLNNSRQDQADLALQHLHSFFASLKEADAFPNPTYCMSSDKTRGVKVVYLVTKKSEQRIAQHKRA